MPPHLRRVGEKREAQEDQTKIEPSIALVSGSANPDLGNAIAAQLGVETAESRIERFPDGELDVAVDPSVRGSDVYICQSLGPPVNDHLIELLLLIDACRRELPARITVVLPYAAYTRKDRRSGSGESVGLRMLADLLGPDRVDRILVVDPHIAQMESVMSVPVEVVSAVGVLSEALSGQVSDDVTVVAPDVGAVKLAEQYADHLGLSDVAVVLKDRRNGTRVEVGGLVGKEVTGPVLIVDDMISTGNTIAAAAEAIEDRWRPSDIIVATTHGLLVGDAFDEIHEHSPSLVMMTDTVRHESLPEAYRTATVSGLLADHIRLLSGGD